MTPEEALAIYHAGPEVVVKVLCALSNQVELLQKQLLKTSLLKTVATVVSLPHLMVSTGLLQKACGHRVNVNQAGRKAILDLHSRWWIILTTQLFIMLINASAVVTA